MDINAGNYQRCIARIAARGRIGQEEAKALLEATADAGERMKRSGMDDPINSAAWSLAQDLKQAATEKMQDAVRNAGKRDNRIAEFTNGNDPKGIRGAIDRVIGRLTKSVGTAWGGKENVESLGGTLSHTWASNMQADFDKAGILKAPRGAGLWAKGYVADAANFKNIAREIWNLRNGKAPGVGPAAKAAQTIYDLQNAMRARLNAEGARIADALDWVGTTAHDALLLRRGGRDQPPTPLYEDGFRRWHDFVLNHLDNKTFDDVHPSGLETQDQANEGFLRRVYNALHTGVHMQTGAAEPGNVGPAFEGTGNLARKLSQGRVLFWKDADHWADYMQQYGTHTDWYELMNKATEMNGKRAALMHYFGTNPAGNLNLILQRMEQIYRDRDPDGVETFKKQMNSRYGVNVQNLMSYLDGSANKPANEMAARIGSTTKAIMNMIYLGSVGITHASSLVTTIPMNARFYGINSFSAMGSLLSSQFKSLSAVDRRELLSQLGAFGDGVAREAQNYFSHGDSFPGRVAAAQNRFMKATLLPYLFDHTKSGVKEMIANHLARNLKTDFGALEAHLQNTLKGYSIGPEEWELLKQGDTLKANSGRTYLTPQNPFGIPDSALEARLRQTGQLTNSSSPVMVQKAIGQLRSDLSDRLSMFYHDAADMAVVTPGARQRSMMAAGNKPGSWTHEMLQTVNMYHAWPLAAMHQMLGRQFYEGLSKGDAAFGVGAILGLSMLGGYIRNTVNDLAAGRQVRTPQNLADAGKIALSSLAAGSGLGLLGDWLFGEINRMGSSNETSIGGPLATTGGRFYEIYNNWAKSLGTAKTYDVWPELGKAATSMVPFTNLFYLKAASDYLVWFHLFEAMKPGWWRRSNEMMKKQQGRTMMGYRPYSPPPFNPFQ